MSDNKVMINIIDEGQGFKEKDTNKIFKRFYSNRPDKMEKKNLENRIEQIIANLLDNATLKMVLD